MISQKHYVFKNVHFLKMLQKRYTGGRFSTLKPLQNKSFFVTCSFSEGIVMIPKSKKTTFRKVIFSQCRKVECTEKSHEGAQRNHIAPGIPQKIMQIPLENVMFSKMVLWLECFYVFELSKQWKFIAFWARRLEIGSGFHLIQGFLYGPKRMDQMCFARDDAYLWWNPNGFLGPRAADTS